ncbi:unnamed protein product [Arctogadus glacialis]
MHHDDEERRSTGVGGGSGVGAVCWLLGRWWGSAGGADGGGPGGGVGGSRGPGPGYCRGREGRRGGGGDGGRGSPARAVGLGRDGRCTWRRLRKAGEDHPLGEGNLGAAYIRGSGGSEGQLFYHTAVEV